MSFCGTPELNRRLKMTGFGMHCTSVAHQLMDFKNKRTHEEFWKGEKEPQLRLFHITTEERERLTQFAGNLRWLVADHTVTHTDKGVISESFWEGYRKFEYTEYEIHQLFEHCEREKVNVTADAIDKAAKGEELTEEEYKTATSFLNSIGYRAQDMYRGGCF